MDTDFTAPCILTEKVDVRYSLENDPFLNQNLNRLQEKFTFVTNHPEENVTDIAASKHLLRSSRFVPERCQLLEENANVQLANLQIKLYNTQKKLDATRRRSNIIRKSVQQQWKCLEEKEELLKMNFQHFNQFIRENVQKRERAQKSIIDDQKLVNERQERIENLQSEIDKMIEVTHVMDKQIKRYRIYQDYLQKVVDFDPEFQAIKCILDRFSDIENTKEMLVKGQGSNMEILEKAKNEMMKLIEEKNFVIMGLNNQIANLQARYENANIKALESEGLVTQIKNNAVKQLGEIDTVKNSIWNVYVHMATSKKHPIKIKKDNFEEQMMYINRTLTELSKVNKLIKKRSSKAK